MTRLQQPQLWLLAGTCGTLALAVSFVMWGIAVPNVEDVFTASAAARSGSPSLLIVLASLGLVAAGVVVGILAANSRAVREARKPLSNNIFYASTLLAVGCLIWGMVQARAFSTTYAGGLGKTVEGLERQLETCDHDANAAPDGIVREAMTDICAAKRTAVDGLVNNAQIRAGSGISEAQSAKDLQKEASKAPLLAEPPDMSRPAQEVMADVAAQVDAIQEAAKGRGTTTPPIPPVSPEKSPGKTAPPEGTDQTTRPDQKTEPDQKSPPPKKAERLTPFEITATYGCLVYGLPPQVCGTAIKILNDLLGGGKLSKDTLGEVLYLVATAAGTDGKFSKQNVEKLLKVVKEFKFNDPEAALSALDKVLEEVGKVGGSDVEGLRRMREGLKDIESLLRSFKECVPLLRKDAKTLIDEAVMAGTVSDQTFDAIRANFKNKIEKHTCYAQLGKVLSDAIADADIDKCVLMWVARSTAFRSQAEALIARHDCMETIKLLER